MSPSGSGTEEALYDAEVAALAKDLHALR